MSKPEIQGYVFDGYVRAQAAFNRYENHVSYDCDECREIRRSDDPRETRFKCDTGKALERTWLALRDAASV